VNHDRICGISVGSDDFFLMRSKFDGGDLGRCLDGVNSGTSGDIPDMDRRV